MGIASSSLPSSPLFPPSPLPYSCPPPSTRLVTPPRALLSSPLSYQSLRPTRRRCRLAPRRTAAEVAAGCVGAVTGGSRPLLWQMRQISQAARSPGNLQRRHLPKTTAAKPQVTTTVSGDRNIRLLNKVSGCCKGQFWTPTSARLEAHAPVAACCELEQPASGGDDLVRHRAEQAGHELCHLLGSCFRCPLRGGCHDSDRDRLCGWSRSWTWRSRLLASLSRGYSIGRGGCCSFFRRARLLRSRHDQICIAKSKTFGMLPKSGNLRGEEFSAVVPVHDVSDRLCRFCFGADPIELLNRSPLALSLG